MTAHLSVPAFEPESEPATVSHNILTGLLRNELRFKGIVVTDAMEMQAVTALYPGGEASVRAIEAGADVLLMPLDPGASIRAIEAAVRAGRISRQRIDASAAKVLAAKRRAGLFRSRLVNPDTISEQIEDEKLDALARSVAERAITLVRDEKHLFPAPALDGSCLVVLSEDSFSTRGETLARELARRMPDLKTFVTNPAMPAELLNAIANQTTRCKQIYAAAFITVAASRGSVDLEGGLDSFLKTLVHNPAPIALIAFGNPYLLRAVPDIGSYAATFSTAVTSETAAAKAILGEIPVGGKMPVDIPGLAKIGDGLTVPAKLKTASNSAD